MTALSPHIFPVLRTASLLGFLLATPVITFPETVSATILVKDDFEVTNLSSQWEGLGINGLLNPVSGFVNGLANAAGSVEMTNAQRFTGSSSVQFNWLKLNTSSIYLSRALPNLNQIYIRFAVKWSPGFQFTPGTTAGKKIWRTFGSPMSDDIVFLVRKTGTVASGLRFSLYVNQMFLHGLTSDLDENIGSATLIETGKWYCFDWHVVGGLGNGTVEGWINGVKKWEYHNIFASSAPMNSFDLGGNISPDKPTQDQTEWYDNAAIANAPIGSTEVAGCAIDVIQPKAPSGLTVN